MIPMPDKPLDQALLEGGEIDLKEINFDPELLKLISPAQARKYCILPLQKKGTVLQLIGPSPLTHEAVEELELYFPLFEDEFHLFFSDIRSYVQSIPYPNR
jgi:hypothetical protein